MRGIAFGVIAVLCLTLDAMAGTIAGKATGLSAASDLSPAVIWLEGAAGTPVSKLNPVMAQKKGHFVPSFLVVTVGQTVEMPNLDEVAHNVYSVSPTKTFNLGFYAKGEHKSVAFDKPGLVEVDCSIHNFMRGKILVLPNAFYATVAADGTFRIGNIPAGKYTFKFWGEGMAPLSGEVVVRSNGITPLDLHVTPQTDSVQK